MIKEFHTIMPNQQSQKPMDESVVKKLIDNHLQLWRNHGFRLGEIESKGEKYEVRATAPGADRIFVVDKYNGWIRSVPLAE
jgi:hypothetical protein